MLKIAVDRGDVSASFMLSWQYYDMIVKPDKSVMPDWLKHVNGAKAAYWAFRHLQTAEKDKISDYCYFILSDLYNRGVGLPEDEAKAFYYAQKAIEAEPMRYYIYIIWLDFIITDGESRSLLLKSRSYAQRFSTLMRNPV